MRICLRTKLFVTPVRPELASSELNYVGILRLAVTAEVVPHSVAVSEEIAVILEQRRSGIDYGDRT